jgi:signal transduction histidine kinase
MDFFLQGRKQTYVDQPKYELSVGAPVMHISTPVMDQTGNAIAVLVGHVDIDELTEIMAEQERLTESMETYLVNQSNLLITESRFEGQAAFRKSIFTSGVNACLQGENGQGVYADYRGIEVVGVYRWLPGWGMCILTEQDQEEAFATVASVRTTIWGVGLGILVVGGLVGFLSARGITKPLNELKRGVRAFGEGDLETRINLDAQDEIGALASAFNEMAANLRDKTKENERLFEELQGWSEELEEKVQVRTTELQREIEERKRAELQLEETLQELERSNEELQRFAYVASHDLQEPLRMVTSYLQLLVRRYGDRLDGDAQEFIDYAVDGAARMKQLINDLLAYSRVKTHGKEFQTTDAEEIVEDVLSNLSVLVEETDAVIGYDSLPQVRADPSQLRQLFQNLIGNAIKFHGQEDPEVRISAQRENGAWLFSVADNGIGMDEKFQDRVFVIFQRLHTDDEYPGTGVGLAVSKRIVERHGGEIWFESQPGEGTTFYFTIPDEPETTP